jgi:transcriptional regulator with XRE-family HTH domain
VVALRVMKFGAYLKRLRLGAKLTQKELARKCSLSDAYINRIEGQEADPPTRQVCMALARALGADGNELWKHAFAARLEKWLKKEGFRRIPDDAASAFYDRLAG